MCFYWEDSQSSYEHSEITVKLCTWYDTISVWLSPLCACCSKRWIRLLEFEDTICSLCYSPSYLHWLEEAISDVNSLMVCFTVWPFNYSSRLHSFTWHFLAAAPDEIAVYHFACYASALLHYVGHLIIPLSCLTFSSFSVMKSIEHALQKKKKKEAFLSPVELGFFSSVLI